MQSLDMATACGGASRWAAPHRSPAGRLRLRPCGEAAVSAFLGSLVPGHQAGMPSVGLGGQGVR